jgi:hypothetical protein
VDDGDYNSDEDVENDFTILRRQAAREQVQDGTREGNGSPALFAWNAHNWIDDDRATPVDQPRTHHRRAPQTPQDGPPNIQGLQRTQPRDQGSHVARPNAQHPQVVRLPAPTRQGVPRRAYRHDFAQVLQPRSPRTSHDFAQTQPTRVQSVQRPPVAPPPPRRSQRSQPVLRGIQSQVHEPAPISDFPIPIVQTIRPVTQETSLDSRLPLRPIQPASSEVRIFSNLIRFLTVFQTLNAARAVPVAGRKRTYAQIAFDDDGETVVQHGVVVPEGQSRAPTRSPSPTRSLPALTPSPPKKPRRGRAKTASKAKVPAGRKSRK